MFALGSGPVKGFAVTLCLGVAWSLFSAILVTRLQIVTWVRRWRPSTLSAGSGPAGPSARCSRRSRWGKRGCGARFRRGLWLRALRPDQPGAGRRGRCPDRHHDDRGTGHRAAHSRRLGVQRPDHAGASAGPAGGRRWRGGVLPAVEPGWPGTSQRAVEAGGLLLGRADRGAAGVGVLAAAGPVHDVQRRLLHAAAHRGGQRAHGHQGTGTAPAPGPGP